MVDLDELMRRDRYYYGAWAVLLVLFIFAVWINTEVRSGLPMLHLHRSKN